MSTHAKAAPGSGRGPARSELVTPTLLRAWPLPGGGSGKDDRGSVLVIGGARMTPGAVLLAGVAALRSGAGRLTLAVAESVAVHLAVALPEAGVLRLPETTSGTVKGSSAAAVLAAPVEAADAVLIGPGLDDKDEASIRAMVDRIVDARVEDGQLDDADLTLKNIAQIKDAFVQQLLGMYHSRIKYPDNVVPLEQRREA